MHHTAGRHVTRERIIAAEVRKLELRQARDRAARSGLSSTAHLPFPRSAPNARIE
jgi:hypothetical protein